MSESNGERRITFKVLFYLAWAVIIIIAGTLLSGFDRRLSSAEEKIQRNTLYKEEVSDHNQDIADIKQMLAEERIDLKEIRNLIIAHDRRWVK